MNLTPTMATAAGALAKLLDDAPDWLPDVRLWEISPSLAADVRGEIHGAMFGRSAAVQHFTMSALASRIGGTFTEDRWRGGAPYTTCIVQFWYAGALFEVVTYARDTREVTA